ncbi:NUDIX hydrolase [Sulfidibacter corallicola]|uniref:GDP-mannose pyrophosphatase n=1 Tax=Sulfidibacter corallicola TaxID=2818388 RepID=A0A8A4TJ08_SULCO|nr:NUDIX hydrolase [Sulfidibacter corallicola]QTD49583.1 NUDIX hydrolase [Sulfidibacter corallicola]
MDRRSEPPQPTILARGDFVQLVRDGHWEYAERHNATGVVVIVAVTDRHELVLVEQYRPAIGSRVVEMPAGLVGDIPGEERESMERAARRELLEETGYEAGSWEFLTEGPPCSGMVSEIISLYLARDLTKVGEGGGDETEDIQVHVVPLEDIDGWLEDKRRNGVAIDPKTYGGLYFALRRTST